MKSILLSAFAAGALLFAASCNKVKDAIPTVHATFTQADITFTIPVIAAGEQTLAQTNVAVNVDSVIKASSSSLGVGNIKSMKIKSCTVSILDNTIFPNDNLTAFTRFGAELASNNVPSGSTVALLDDTVIDGPYMTKLPIQGNNELKEYFKGATFTYRLFGKASRATEHEMTAKLTLTYDLELQP